MKCSTSLWSADLANLAAEIKRVEPYSDRFHLDVADGHYVPNLLFFPDQVKAVRPHTKLPFEVHLMTTNPEAWIDPFIEAGADIFIACYDSTKDPAKFLQTVRAQGKQAGLSLHIEEPLELITPLLPHLDILTLMGTEVGIKGASLHPSIPQKIHAARALLPAQTLIQADGGIRRETVPLLKTSGADYIVPGSLMFKEDPKTMRAWLDSLP